MDDDFTFKEEKGDQAGGPETSKVDQKHGVPSYNLYQRTTVCWEGEKDEKASSV